MKSTPTARYPNPLIPGFNPDPSCVLVGGTYYLVTSSFEYLPGLPIYRSTDFVTWEHIANVAVREQQVDLRGAPSGGGVWAPTIRHRDGLFYVIVCVLGGSRSCVVYTASDPAGPWSDGTTITGIEGIDPDLAWDDSGAAYVTYSGLTFDNSGVPIHRGILQARVDLSTGARLEEPRSLWSGTGRVAPESPHLYSRDGYWYLVIAEGGTERGHSVSVARSTSIEGPFEGAAHNPVLTASGTTNPVQCTGHADLVTGPDGRDLMVLLGTRQAGATSPLGRETYVSAVEWVEGWPRPATVGLQLRSESYDERFVFDDQAVLTEPGWLAVRQSPLDAATMDPEHGHLVLVAPQDERAAARPAFLGRRQRHLRSVFTCQVDVSDGAGGLLLRFDESFFISLAAVPGRVTARAALPTLAQEWSTAASGATMTLRIETHEPLPAATVWSRGGDLIRLVVAHEGGEECVVAEVDGRFWSVETAQPFTGRVTGMYAEAGTVRFRSFSYHGDGGS